MLAAIHPVGFQWVLVVALVFFLVFQTAEILNQMVLVPLKHRKAIAALKSKSSIIGIYLKNDRFSFFGVYLVEWLAVPLLLVIGFGNASSGYLLLPVWALYLGAILMALGETIRLWSTYTLGKFFTFVMVVTKDHKLITKGPYRFVRHPAYFGGLVLVVGTGLLTGLLIAPVAALILTCLAYSYRIHVEEKALRRKFGKAYADYSKRTAMIIPHLF